MSDAVQISLESTGVPGRQEQPAVGETIQRAIREAAARLCARWPILERRDALGAASLLAGLCGFAAGTAAYLQGALPAAACIVINGVCLSILREVEHDLIHVLYFRRSQALRYAVMFLIWPFLGNYPNPFYRRWMHLLHHRRSGQADDVEEKLIGNGLRFGPVRLLAMLDTPLSIPFRRRELAAIPGFSLARLSLALWPVVPAFNLAWYCFLAFHAWRLGAAALGIQTAVADSFARAMTMVNALAVVWVIPNVIRQVSLAVLSSNNHYTGDVEGLEQETQVLSAWYLLPLQLSTFNFGRTHALHHFVVEHPFYLRQLAALEAEPVLLRFGVRRNDFGTLFRRNRYHRDGAAAPRAGAER